MMEKFVIGILKLINVKDGVIVLVEILIIHQLLHVLNFHVIIMHQLENVQLELVQLLHNKQHVLWYGIFHKKYLFNVNG